MTHLTLVGYSTTSKLVGILLDVILEKKLGIITWLHVLQLRDRDDMIYIPCMFLCFQHVLLDLHIQDWHVRFLLNSFLFSLQLCQILLKHLNVSSPTFSFLPWNRKNHERCQSVSISFTLLYTQSSVTWIRDLEAFVFRFFKICINSLTVTRSGVLNYNKSLTLTIISLNSNKCGASI